MLMRIALVYVLAVTSTVFAFALYWQEGRLASIQDSFLRASNELTAKTAEADKLRELKTAAEERAFFAEARLRDAAADHQSVAGQIANVRRIQAEAEAALNKAQAATREEADAKAAALARVTELEAKLNRMTAEQGSARAQPAGASAKPDAPAAPPPLAAAAPAPDAASLKQKLKIEPDPTVRGPSSTLMGTVTTGAIAPNAATESSQPPPQVSPDQKPDAVSQSDQAPSSDAKSNDPGKTEVKTDAEKAKKAKTAATKRKPRVVEKSDSFFPF